MREPPLISIVIPAFNAACVIAETLASVRAQTFPDFEVLIVDDGSTDETHALAAKFCETDPRFKVMQQSNQGVSSARNRAIQSARGEWIAFLDADDVWFPRKLECQVGLSRKNPQANLLITNCFIWNGQCDLYTWYGKNWPLPHGDVTQKVISNICHACAACMSAAMMRRETLLSLGLFDPEIYSCEDWDLLLRMAEDGLRVAGTEEPLVRYRRWPGNKTADCIKTSEAGIRVLEKNLRRTRRADLRPLYERSLSQRRKNLQAARAKRELTRAYELLATDPEKIPRAVWCAWRLNPRRIKWLARYLLVAWPKILGGDFTARIVHRKLSDRFEREKARGLAASSLADKAAT